MAYVRHSGQSWLAGILTIKFYWSGSLLAKADVNRVDERTLCTWGFNNVWLMLVILTQVDWRACWPQCLIDPYPSLAKVVLGLINKRRLWNRCLLKHLILFAAFNVSHCQKNWWHEVTDSSNYVLWKEKLEISLVLLSIDYALLHDLPKVPK